MKEYIVVSAIGRDRPGLVNRIAHEVTDAGGNIEMQRSQILAGDFALLMLVSMDPDDGHTQGAIERLSALSSEELSVLVRKAHDIEEVPSDAQYAELIASGVDQPGLIDGVTLHLLRENINIAKMFYDVGSAPMTGTAHLHMRALLIVPGSVDYSDLRETLDHMERNLHIDVLIRHPITPDDIDW